MPTLPIRRLWSLLSVLVLGLALPCCGEDRSADTEAIKTVWANYDAFNKSRSGSAMANILTAESIAYYDGLVKIILDGKQEQVASLPIVDRLEVVRARVRAKRSQLKGLDGRGYLIYATNDGWYDPEDGGESEREVLGTPKYSPDGNTCTCELLARVEVESPRMRGGRRRAIGSLISAGIHAAKTDEDGKQLVSTGNSVTFRKEFGTWKLDERTALAGYSAALTEGAKEAGMSERDFVMAVIEDETGKDVPMTVWGPMKK